MSLRWNNFCTAVLGGGVLTAMASHTAPAAFTPRTFSAGLSGEGGSGHFLTQTETTLLNVTIDPGDLGALTYFWITGTHTAAVAMIRVYVDGETVPSIVFQPAKVAGIGIGDVGTELHSNEYVQLPPWSNSWFGQLGRYAYHTTIRIPFQKSLRLTFQSGPGEPDDAVWIQARAVSGLGDGLKDIISGITLPPTARLVLQRRENITYAPLDYMTLADVATGSGCVFATSLWWQNASSNTIEGCVRAFIPHSASWPGTLLSTGWEDYYASAWGMVDGAWQGELSGSTHWTAPGNHDASVYRIHAKDPIFFDGGVRLVLRNGDTTDSRGKCFLETGGSPVGHPGETTLGVYAWLYVW